MPTHGNNPLAEGTGGIERLLNEQLALVSRVISEQLQVISKTKLGSANRVAAVSQHREDTFTKEGTPAKQAARNLHGVVVETSPARASR